MYLIDTSEDVTLDTIAVMQKYIRNHISTLTISPDQVRVSIVSYGESADVKLNLASGITVDKVLSSLTSISRVGGKRDLSEVLDTVNKRVLSDLEIRKGAGKMIVLFVNGKDHSVSKDYLSLVVEKLRSSQVQVTVIGIGSDVDSQIIGTIATLPTDILLITHIHEIHIITPGLSHGMGTAVAKGKCTYFTIVLELYSFYQVR